MATYTNPWHKPHSLVFGPASFETDVKPIKYRAHLIYQRLPQCFDIVVDDVCVHQRAGINGAKAAIDARVA
ncbi:hypothetical protein [Bordetella bronchiseptica]|uniref:hypothetical protein n=1 Tax=Bordetella bronchiseptica TaxID=518 RepID=UPI0002FD4751|nr:hypothetical protein [Bordetella bronchiseptica]